MSISTATPCLRRRIETSSELAAALLHALPVRATIDERGRAMQGDGSVIATSFMDLVATEIRITNERSSGDGRRSIYPHAGQRNVPDVPSGHAVEK
ncbi:hypothetical protein [Rhodopseudomonas sp. P2A-2r]|uniref:hypothetical protein n=1 Tax=unclassified Rhodopseudomonas TaxID=2638247 RepID=UPI00223409DF|nr:hypothetical protein [Rhodopseudomonas sp. P2A-2r]UZE50686.1 hypothetical protein ONR75_08560 [Rhodopseudomonas sp. P2A-2r]